MTQWLYRVMIFVRAADATQARKDALAQIYVDGNSGESLENEKKMLNSVVKLSTSGNLPAQVFGVSTAAKLSMRDGFKTLLDTLTNARYAVTANVAHGQFQEGELILTNFPGVVPNGQIVTWADALARLNADFGLQVIQPEDVE